MASLPKSKSGAPFARAGGPPISGDSSCACCGCPTLCAGCASSYTWTTAGFAVDPASLSVCCKSWVGDFNGVFVLAQFGTTCLWTVSVTSGFPGCNYVWQLTTVGTNWVLSTSMSGAAVAFTQPCTSACPPLGGWGAATLWTCSGTAGTGTLA